MCVSDIVLEQVCGPCFAPTYYFASSLLVCLCAVRPLCLHGYTPLSICAPLTFSSLFPLSFELPVAGFGDHLTLPLHQPSKHVVSAKLAWLDFLGIRQTTPRNHHLTRSSTPWRVFWPVILTDLGGFRPLHLSRAGILHVTLTEFRPAERTSFERQLLLPPSPDGSATYTFSLRNCRVCHGLWITRVTPNDQTSLRFALLQPLLWCITRHACELAAPCLWE